MVYSKMINERKHLRDEARMKRPILLLLGGYGNTGQKLSRLLLAETDAQLIIAGRSHEKAAAEAGELNRICSEDRAVGIAADAANEKSLRQALSGVDMIVVVSSTAQYTRQVATAALEAGCDYLDIQYSTQKFAILQSLSGQIEKSGRCFITDGGFHPGLPAALVRYAASRYDTIEKAVVGSVLKQDWAGFNVPDDTILELVEELNDYVPLVYRQGQWKKISLLDPYGYTSMDFGGEFNKQYCASMFLEEMRSLPEQHPSLQETGFYVGGFNWFVDWLLLPLGMVAFKISPKRASRPVAKLMKWGLCKFSRPPYGMVLKLESEGRKAGSKKTFQLSLRHPDGYLFTAIPVAACLLQFLDGSVRKPGLWTQANLVEPARFMNDMRRMGVSIIEEEGE